MKTPFTITGTGTVLDASGNQLGTNGLIGTRAFTLGRITVTAGGTQSIAVYDTASGTGTSPVLGTFTFVGGGVVSHDYEGYRTKNGLRVVPSATGATIVFNVE